MVRNRFELGGLVCALLALTACGAQSGDSSDGSAFGEQAFALTTAESVLGFESTQVWSVSSGTLVATSVRSQGSAALSVTPNGFAQLTSVPLSTLTGATSTLSLDVQPSVPLGWGQVQLFISAPSRGLYSAFAGQGSLAGRPASAFSRIDFALPSDVQQALAGAYSDLTLTIGVSVAEGSVVLDNLRFAGHPSEDCADGSPYTLTIIGADGVDPDTVEGIRCTFYEVYPQLAAAYNPATQVTVPLTFKPETPNMPPAWVENGGVYINKGHIARNPLDWDVIVHEAMHIVQAGYTGTRPGWIIEGTADFVRDKYGLTNEENGWSIPTGYEYGHHYTAGYGEAAAFFKWIDAQYRVGQSSVTQALDDILRAGTYSEAQTWISLTGSSLLQLWDGYSGGLAPAPATQGITVYEDANFGGLSVKLDRGTYPLLELRARGVRNDWISSIEVPAGYTLRAFTDDGFQGTEYVHSATTSFLGTQNDLFSSLIVQ
jgi:hypothetical protein